MTDTQTIETRSLHLKQIGTNSASTLLQESFGSKYKEHIDACINLAMVEHPTEALTVKKIINTRKTNKQSRKRRYDKRVPKYKSSGTINETTELINEIYTKNFIKPVIGYSLCTEIQRMPGFYMSQNISTGFNPDESIISPENKITRKISEHMDFDKKSIATSVDTSTIDIFVQGNIPKKIKGLMRFSCLSRINLH